MHTPGDWVVDSDGLTVVEKWSGLVIAVCQTPGDALLIVRAPELREYVNRVKGTSADHGMSQYWDLSAAERLVNRADGIFR